MKSLADLEAIRAKTLESINMRKDENAARVVIGMATCGSPLRNASDCSLGILLVLTMVSFCFSI